MKQAVDIKVHGLFFCIEYNLLAFQLANQLNAKLIIAISKKYVMLMLAITKKERGNKNEKSDCSMWRSSSNIDSSGE